MRYILILVILISGLFAELSLSLGLTHGQQQQILSGSEESQHTNELSLRPAYFFELDSVDHPLFFANDQMVYGIGFLTETAHKDVLDNANLQMSIPFYLTYYLRYGTQAIGFGFSLNILQLRHRNHTNMQGQQLGKQLFWRVNGNNSFVELGVMQLCARGDYPAEDIISFYDSVNFIWRYGFYLGGKNTMP